MEHITKKDRITYLKTLKQLANKYLAENKEIKKLSKPGWQNSAIEHNIAQLQIIIKEINNSLSEKSLAKFLESQQTIASVDKSDAKSLENVEVLDAFSNLMISVIHPHEITRYSSTYSIVNDLYWLKEGTVDEHLQIALGKANPSVLEQYLPKKLEVIEKEFIPYLNVENKYLDIANIVSTAVSLARSNSFLQSNILMIVAVESFTRALAKYVYEKQNPERSNMEIDFYIFEKFLSLEGLIKDGNWKRDIPMELSEARVMHRLIPDEYLQEASEIYTKHEIAFSKFSVLLNEITERIKSKEDDTDQHTFDIYIEQKSKEMEQITKDLIFNRPSHIFINLRTKLYFLIRRYKEDRNSIIHGKFTDFDTAWKGLVYSCALIEVFECYKLYKNLYP